MDKYVPRDSETLRMSNLQYGLFKWFYKRGLSFTLPFEDGLKLDQRAFGPAVARGIFETDGIVWWMTEAGRTFVEHYERRTPWKQTTGQNWSHYIKVRRTVEAIRRGKRSRLSLVRSATA